MYRLIYLLIHLSLTNSYPLYTLYNRQAQYQNPLEKDWKLLKTIIPEESQPIITIQQNPLQSSGYYLTFFKIGDQKISKIYDNYLSFPFPDYQDLVDAFWVNNQFLLIIGTQWKVLYRPPLKGLTAYFATLPANYIIRAGFVRKNKNGINQLITISDINLQWMLWIQSLTYNSTILVQTIPLFLADNENLISLVNLKDFWCAFSIHFDLSKYYYRLSCHHLDSSHVYTTEFQQVFYIGDVTFNQTMNTIYCVVVKSIMVRYELSLRNNSLQIDRKYLFNDTQIVQIIRIDNKTIILYVLQMEPPRAYLAIISISNPQKPFYYQLIEPKVSEKDNYYCKILIRQKQIYFIPYYKADDWFLFFQTHHQLPLFFISSTFIICAILILGVAFKSVIKYPIYCQIFKIEQRLKITLFQFALTLVVLPTAALIQILSTDTTKSTNFAPSFTRLVPLESYTLKVFNLLFIFTSLISTVFQTYTSHRSKSRYLSVLIKHGLSAQVYFFVKQHFIVMKALIYSTLSTYFLVFLDQNYSSEQFQLFPTAGQLLTVIVAYFGCFFTAYNTYLILVYCFANYWLNMCFSLSMAFLIAFSSGQFYLNNVVSIEQLCLVAVSPQALFSAITQHIFKIEVRFNEELSTYFLFGALIAQMIIVILIHYAIFIQLRYKKTKDSSLTHTNQSNVNKAINESQERASEKNIQSPLICNGVSSNALLDVFIPCKLSKNEGFQKINLLKNIRFTANKGQIIVFADNANRSKAMLFKILVDEEKSDSHIEKGIAGSVKYQQLIRISYLFQNQHYFEDLNVYQHLQLYSILKNPKMSRQERKSKIEFMLNQFNIPDEFRIMKPSELSGGYLKKMCLACAFIGEPDVVIIDQPSLGLDNRFRGILYQKLREWKQNKLIIVGTSDNSQAENISDKIWTLRKSKIVDINFQKQKRFITLVSLHFQEENDFSQTEEQVAVIFKDTQARLISSVNQIKTRYVLRIQIYHRQDQI